uniref:Uncharacterized protein n=1 Tax=Rhizophora mucronata TaxID=61149 RepID=A0A2P2NFR5_RHIMU
MLQIQQGGYPL